MSLSAKIAVSKASWPFLCPRLPIEISCFLQLLSKLVDKTKLPKFGKRLKAFCSDCSKVTGITAPAIDVLKSYDWPGNIRQLKKCIRTMVVMAESDSLDVCDIPPDIARRRQLGAGVKQSKDLSGMSLNEIEKQAIIDTLNRTGNNREKAAKILGIGERTLYRKIKEYNL